jgi:hypothetical protein
MNTFLYQMPSIGECLSRAEFPILRIHHHYLTLVGTGGGGGDLWNPHTGEGLTFTAEETLLPLNRKKGDVQIEMNSKESSSFSWIME